MYSMTFRPYDLRQVLLGVVTPDEDRSVKTLCLTCHFTSTS